VTSPSYEYFGNLTTGGFELADFCPISLPVNEPNNTFMADSCVFGIGTFPADLEESISSNSACFISTLVNNNYTKAMRNYVGQSKAICYQYTCDPSTQTTIVTVGNSSTVCPTNGGTATINNYSGVLYCPDYNSVCTSTVACSSMVQCALNNVTASPNTNTYNYTVNYTSPTGNSAITPTTTYTSSVIQDGNVNTTFIGNNSSNSSTSSTPNSTSSSSNNTTTAINSSTVIIISSNDTSSKGRLLQILWIVYGLITILLL